MIIVLALCIGVSYASMQWTRLEDEQAVCNDYSRAGFFFEKTNTSKWVIFLESGGLCYSAESCNERFFKPSVRTEFARNKDEQFYEFDPDFDLERTWTTLKSQNRSLSDRLNPYMTSIGTYIRDDPSFAQVEGRDLLQSSQALNPVFYDFNRVVVPYCSSDLWMAEDNFAAEGVDLTSDNPQQQFLDNAYSPENEALQFTFRGRTILKSIIRLLLENYTLSNATEILLAGSSAGGLGVVNNAKWIISELSNYTDVSVLVDSSWFINFRGNIYRRFDGTERGSDSSTDRNDDRLFDLIRSIPQCDEESPTGSPCCISLDCVLQRTEYFPVGQVPVMVVASLYDVFLLADAIAQETLPGDRTNSNSLPSLGVDFVLTTAEYGGAMNSSISNTAPEVDRLSYIATQCLQHIYVATSSLWDSNGILGESSMEEIGASLGAFSGSISHNIQSNVWNSYMTSDDSSAFDSTYPSLSIDSCNHTKARTMQDAINLWYTCRNINDSFAFRDNCSSIHCHNSCPERLEFLQISSDSYPQWSIILIICIVVSLTVISIAAKIAFSAWKYVLFEKQDQYLDRVEKDEENFLDGIPQFPVCGLEDAVSIACLDLKYSVTFRKKKAKDERRDSTTVSFAIAHHIAQEENQENLSFNRGSERRSTRSIRSTRSTIRNTEAITVPDTTGTSTSRLGVIAEETNENIDANGLQTKNQNHSPRTSNSSLQRQNAHDVKESRVSYSSLPDMNMDETDGGIDEGNDSKCIPCRGQTKQILKGISIYFNPGELVGIMGPSGCGKTTFLDLLTGRRRAGHMEGNIFVNGIPLNRVRDEYMSFTGYVLQLATPYHEELTVRENVTLAAQMKLPRTMTWRKKFERVEQVIDVTGLTNVADLIVGGLSGPGLSGGQKKRLTIALQLLTMPKVIFLDEPTSGLDSTASVELLSHLNTLADSNRTVVLTIHQPRLEIFHMFHKLVLLSDGKIAYHGLPQKAYGFFVEAALSSFWNKKLTIPEIGDHNPADIIMDMLGKPIFRRAILSHYQESTEPALIKWAVRRARVKDFESTSIATLDNDFSLDTFKRLSSTTTPYQIQQSDFVKQDKASWFNRLSVLETRADKRATLVWKMYLPVVFFGYGLLLGTIYFQQEQPLLIMAGFCVYSVASALFMFPVMQNYFIKALEVYGYESADGAGRASDIVLQSFARFSTMAIIPVVLCSLVLYFLLVKIDHWNIVTLLQLIVVGMALNQTWISLLTCLLCAIPSLAFRLSPIISSVAGFFSGFFVPMKDVSWLYRWVFYINPNYYGFSASANILLKDIGDDCETGSEFLQCYISSGNYVLRQFYFDDIRPFMNIAILLLMTLLYFLLAIFCNWVRHTSFFLKIKTKASSKKTFMDEEDDSILSDERGDDIEETELLSPDEDDDDDEDDDETVATMITSSERSSSELQHLRDKTSSPIEDDVFETNASSDASSEGKKKNAEVKQKWLRFAQDSLEKKHDEEELEMLSLKDPALDSKGRPKRLDFRQKQRRKRIQSIFLDNKEHMVYNPSIRKSPTTPGSQFANLVNNLMVQKRAESTAPSPTPSTAAGNSLKERREQFEWSIKATQEVVKEHTEELNKADEMQREKMTLRDVTKKVTKKLKEEKPQPKLASVVGEVMKLASSAPSSFEEESDESQERRRTSSLPGIPKIKRRQRQESSSNLFANKWREKTKKQTGHKPPVMRKVSTVADFDLSSKQKNKFAKRSTEMHLPLSGGATGRRSTGSNSTTDASPRTEDRSPIGLSRMLTSPKIILEEIKEDDDEVNTVSILHEEELSPELPGGVAGKYQLLSEPEKSSPLSTEV